MCTYGGRNLGRKRLLISQEVMRARPIEEMGENIHKMGVFFPFSDTISRKSSMIHYIFCWDFTTFL
jgi:hypothetical protein